MNLLQKNSESDEFCTCLEDLPLAYSYVPYQEFNTVYSAEDALKNGTVFPDLNKPMSVYGKEFQRARMGGMFSGN